MCVLFVMLLTLQSFRYVAAPKCTKSLSLFSLSVLSRGLLKHERQHEREQYTLLFDPRAPLLLLSLSLLCVLVMNIQRYYSN